MIICRRNKHFMLELFLCPSIFFFVQLINNWALVPGLFMPVIKHTSFYLLKVRNFKTILKMNVVLVNKSTQ